MGQLRGKKPATETSTSSQGVPHRVSSGTISQTAVTGMTSDSQTLRGASRSIPSLTSPKQVVDIGFWNVRTMFQDSKVEQITREFKQYKLDILGISEARWTESGKTSLGTGEVVLWSGCERVHEKGVALMLSKRAAASLEEWRPVSERILIARFFSKYARMTVIVCYAPTNQADEEEKETFYLQLQSVIRKVSSHDMLIVGGDFNAKIGSDNSQFESCMGKFGLGEMNENGLLLADFCQENSLVIGGSLFRHKDVHKYTWEAPGGRARNQIDHILVNRKWINSLYDVRNKRGADVSSDHVLVWARLKLSLKTKKKTSKRSKFDVEKLKQPRVVEQFKVSVANRFAVLEEVEDINQLWNKVRDGLKEAASEVLGRPRRKRKKWLSDESWDLIEERKRLHVDLLKEDNTEEMKERLRQQYREKEAEVKRSVRRDKRCHLRQQAREAEEAAQRKDTRTLYQIGKSLGKGNDFGGQGHVKDKDGVVLIKESEQRERWAEHFEEVLNREVPSVSPEEFNQADLDINCYPLSENEIRLAIRRMKSNKAAGVDNLVAELFKVCEDETTAALKKLFDKIWEEERVPDEWLKGIIVKLPKKGDRLDCNNWRGVTLLLVASKIFARGLFERVQSPVERILRKNQAGFRKGRSTTDQILVLRRLIEEAQEMQRALVIVFVDFEKAFDSVFREALWTILKGYGFPEKIIRLIRCLYDGFECTVLHEGEFSRFFVVETGVKQGCLLSGLLFVVIIDWLMRQTTEGRDTGVAWVGEEILEDLDYADDLALTSEGIDDSQEKITRLVRRAKKVGLKVNVKKTKLLKVNCNDNREVRVGGDALEVVGDFCYLGGTLTEQGGTSEDIAGRLQKARGAFENLRTLWSSREISLSTKLTFFSSIVMSTLLYGCECWTLTGGLEKKIQVFQRKCLRRILGIFYPNRISNVELLRTTRQIDIAVEISDRKWRWIGHVARRDAGHLTRQSFEFAMDGGRRRGRPRETWIRVARREFHEALGLSFDDVVRLAQDRDTWRRLVVAVRTDKAHRVR